MAPPNGNPPSPAVLAVGQPAWWNGGLRGRQRRFGSLVVSAAASLDTAFNDYVDAAGIDAKMSFAGSDELAAQIRQGVKPDVYAAANTTLPDELHKEGLVGEPTVFATNTLVLAVPQDCRSIPSTT